MERTGIEHQQNVYIGNKWRLGLLSCGLLSSLFYMAMNVLSAMLYPGYSSFSQTISEFSAIDAPTRTIWVTLAVVYSLLVMGFGLGVQSSASGNRHLSRMGFLIMVNGFIGLFWPPMHQREVLAAGGGTMTDTLHIIFAFVTVFLFLLTLAFGASAFNKGFRFYSILTILVLAVFGMLTGLDSPKLEANLPTPWIGVWERINIGVYMLWLSILSVRLMNK